MRIKVKNGFELDLTQLSIAERQALATALYVSAFGAPPPITTQGELEAKVARVADLAIDVLTDRKGLREAWARVGPLVKKSVHAEMLRVVMSVVARAPTRGNGTLGQQEQCPSEARWHDDGKITSCEYAAGHVDDHFDGLAHWDDAHAHTSCDAMPEARRA